MKKALCVRLAAVAVLSVAVCASSAAAASVTAAARAAIAAEAVKIGLSVTGSLANSYAAGEDDGNAQADVTVVAVTVDNNGVINNCVIDMIQTRAGFDKNGKLLTDTSAVFLGKNEQGDDYGMRGASAIGKEWYEQAAAFAEYVKGKTIADLEGMAIDADGKTTDADLAASVSIAIGEFIPNVIDAVKKAEDLGASKGDKLVLISESTIANSWDAAADADGQVQISDPVCALTLNGDTITGCFVDTFQGTVKFNDKGELTGDIGAAVESKDALGDAYGMRAASPIGKEWNEQARAFADYVTGKTLNDAAGIAINEKGKTEDTDLAAGCTMNIGGFISILKKAKR